MESKKHSAKNDIILILVIIVAAVILLFAFRQYKKGADAAGYAVVKVDGEEFKRYPLDEDRTDVIETDYGSNYLEITDGVVNMTDADCPDQVCVDMKPISKTGETIVCLPHKLVVEIEGSEESEFDSIAQ